MRTRLRLAGISVAIVVGLAVVGGVALAAEDNPSRGGTPSPAASTADDKGGLRGGNGADDPAGHDVNDDKGGRRAGGSDDPAGHDAGDDKGGQRAGDDKGGQRSGR
ncbi:hypothetical protein [Planosporangium flavigriseum]|uniref:Uncharacterized protein n=1 Tax=Planosporangium flavigriseum TaxID=373681 RepID=A0A8J3LMD9_9ACTN|nr:hypothetical protein [Planosporangium flavigriseum]GIG75833.1 hypothetical protein Pfl04_42370 [Planosporangium flavigriseum]